jgi:hypothetical protein
VLDRLTALLTHWATRRNVLLFVALFLVMNAVLLPLATARLSVLSGGAAPLDSRMSYTPDQAYAVLEAYGPAGRDFDLNAELTVDLVYPIVYGLFCSLAILYFLQRFATGRPALARLALVPFLAVLVDYLENASLIVLLLTYPQRLTAVAALAGLLTTTKWVLLGLSLVLVAASAAGALLARRQPVDPAPQ